MDPAGRLLAAAHPLLSRLSTWTARSWAHPVAAGRSRADLAHRATGRLADLAAELEGRAPHPVPRLADDLGLVDQLAVMVHDVAATGDPGGCRQATAIVAELDDQLRR